MVKETVLEEPSRNSRETVVEDSDLNNQHPRASRITLPEEILERYEYLRDLPSGAESDAILLRDKESGEECFFKYYRPGLSPDPMAMLLLKSADPRYVARLVDYHDSDDGCWEIQEYYPLGSLETWAASQGGVLNDVQIVEIASALADDLKYLHGLGSGIAHRDLKPSNILVKNDAPISLVLADFGLAKAHQNITHLTTTVKGTWHYAAPEVQSKQSSAKSDWFSLGSILYEYSTGRCLFSDADGNPVPDDEARARCLSGYYSADLVENGRIRLLISGLLCWDKNERWGAKEVERWLAGESPAVSQAKPGPARAHSTATKSRINYRAPFSAELASNYADLARMIRDNWSPFADMLAGRPDEKLVRFVEAVGQSEDYAVMAQDVLRIIPGSDLPEYKLVQLQALLDPFATPVFRGGNLDNESVSAAIEKANAGDSSSIEWLDAIVETQVFGALSEVLGSGELAKADYYLSEWTRQIEESLALLPDDQKDVGEAAKATASPILVECALSMGSIGLSETAESINGTSEKLCAANYIKKTEEVAPIIGLLQGAENNDIGYAIVFNAYLTQVYEMETDRCKTVYEQATSDIAAGHYEAAIEELESIPSFRDADDLRRSAAQALSKAKTQYKEAKQEAESGHFQKAAELFTSLEGYEDSAQMAEAAKKAADFMERITNPEKEIEADIARIAGQIDQCAEDRDKLAAKVLEAQKTYDAADEQVQDAEYALDVLCMNASFGLMEQIRDLEARRSDAGDVQLSASAKTRSAQDAFNRTVDRLQDREAWLESIKKDLSSARLKLSQAESARKAAERDSSQAQAREAEALQNLEEKKGLLAAAQDLLTPLAAMESKLIKPFGFKNDLAAAKEAVETAKGELASADEVCRIARSSSDACRSRLADCQATRTRLADEIKRLEKAVSSTEGEMASLRTGKTEKKTSLDAARTSLVEAISSCAALDQAIEQLKTEVNEVRAKTKETNSKDVEELEKERKLLRKHLDTLIRDEKALVTRADQLEEQKQNLERQLKKAKKPSSSKKIDPKALFLASYDGDPYVEEKLALKVKGTSIESSGGGKAKFANGDIVVHKDFGRGRITRVDGDTVYVRFDCSGQTKKLLSDYALIKKIGS